MNIKTIINNFCDALFPNHIKCVLCGIDLAKQNIYDLCPKCKDKITLNNGKTCTRCGKPVWAGARVCPTCKPLKRHFDGAKAPTIYNEDNGFLIRQFKYHNHQYLGKTFAKIMTNEFLKSSYEIDLIIPVPMFEKRKQERGYNQSDILATEISKATHIPIDTTNFIRKRDTIQQAKMTKREREENLQDAFKVVNKQSIKDKRILLIDDVITTGSTIDECALTLKNAGAKSVYCIAYAHTATKMHFFKQNISLKDPKIFENEKKIMYNTQSTNKMNDDSFFDTHKYVKNKALIKNIIAKKDVHL